MSKCTICGGSFPTTQFVCEYCGHVETQRVKKIDVNTVKEISFQDSMKLIHENLNALQQIHRPDVSEGVIAVLRIYVAILTFGIVLLFWKKPEKRFNKKEYNKLKAIVKRNIELLKLSAKGSDQLQERIMVVEDDLKDVDQKIKTSIRTKQIVTSIVIIFLIGLGYFNKDDDQEAGIEVIPISNKVEGGLSEKLEIDIDKYSVFYTLNDEKNIDKLKISLKLEVIGKHKFAKNEILNISMFLKNTKGDNLANFSESKLNKENTDKIKRALKLGSKRKIPLTFYFKPQKEINQAPNNLEKFSITAIIDTVGVK